MNVLRIYTEAEMNAARQARMNDGDYINEDDGLLYCGKCHTRKQSRIEIFGAIRTPFCDCKCETERKQNEENAKKKAEKVERLRRDGGITPKMQRWTFENDDNKNPQLFHKMREFADNFDIMQKGGKGLLLFGKVGRGKSFAAGCVANALIDKDIPVKVTNFSTIHNEIMGKFEDRQQYIDRMIDFPLLIIDDLAAEGKTEFMQQIVYNIIESRDQSGKPLIVTTNLTREELLHPADVNNQRIFSRLLGMCLPIEVKGDDKRRDELKQGLTDYKDVLGL